jgi:hypothetical protein
LYFTFSIQHLSGQPIRKLIPHAGQARVTVSRHIYGHFSEQLDNGAHISDGRLVIDLSPMSLVLQKIFKRPIDLLDKNFDYKQQSFSDH